MVRRNLVCAAAVMAACVSFAAPVWAFDDTKFPDLSGQWVAVRIPGVRGQPAFDPTKSLGFAQDAPLTPEYRKVLEQSLADQAQGSQGNWLSGVACIPTGMPTMMTLYRPAEFVVLPEVTYVLIDHTTDAHRRIYTDGRDWPKDIEPTYVGYSIGKWIDETGDGHFNVLEVETRHLKGPRSLDPAGMPTHMDNQSIVKERISLDKKDPTLLYDEITLIDHAFTRPWTVLKTYRRVASEFPDWPEDGCDTEGMVRIGKETYFRSGDGALMPTHAGQPAPDLRYFKKPGE